MLKPIFEKRREAVKTIPRFWYTVFVVSELLADFINFEDQELLEHLVDLHVEWSEANGKDFTISFEFEENEYLESLKLEKKFTYKEKKVKDEDGEEVIEKKYTSEPVPIKWKKGKNLIQFAKEQNSFFSWFEFVGEGPGDFAGGEMAALTLADEIFPNALKFYVEAFEGGDSDLEGEEYDISGDDSEGEEENGQAEDKEGPKAKKQKVN